MQKQVWPIQMSVSFRDNYAQGVETYYEHYGDNYKNPHDPRLQRVLKVMLDRWNALASFEKTLDLACGSGEVTVAIQNWFTPRGVTVNVGSFEDGTTTPNEIFVEATDPFTFKAYENRIGVPAKRISFEDIESGCLETVYTMIISSYAMHLIEPSRLFTTCQQLAFAAHHMIVISPHKRPVIDSSMGWQLEQQFIEDRTHLWLYKSLYH